jgi:hypothetical protein
MIKMEIKLTKQEVDQITSVLGEVPAKYTYAVIKLFEQKLAEAAKEAEPVEPVVENA